MTATSEADPNASDSITVHIGHSTLTSAWKQDAGNASFGLGPVLRVGGGVSAPHAVYAPDPEYSKEAREANYRGACILWLIVGTDGLPRNIKVVRSAGMGLDENALEAVKRWRFQPALKDGKPVAVQINVEVTFRPN